MKYCLMLLCLLFALPVFADALLDDRAQKCRRQLHSKANLYIEDREYCMNLLMRDSIEKFNEFAEQRGPVVDCQEAKESPALVNACRAVGIAKVKRQAREWGVTLRDQDIYACDVDDRFYNPFKYVSFCADTRKGKVQVLTQKPVFRDCF